MEKFCYFLTGCLGLALCPVFALRWHRRSHARYFPLLAGILFYMGISFIRLPIRAAIPKGDTTTYHLLQTFCNALLEEGGRVLAFHFALPQYDRREEPVMYGIGHSLPETFSAAFVSFGFIFEPLIGEDSLAFGILWLLKEGFFQTCGLLLHIALSVILFYAMQTGSVRVFLPAAVLCHMILNLTRIFLPMSADFVVTLLATPALCYAAYQCTRALPATFFDFDEQKEGSS